MRYRYGLRGERLSKTVQGVTTWFHYEANDAAGGLRLSAELDAHGALRSQYFHAYGRVLARVDIRPPQGSIAQLWWRIRSWVMGAWGGVPAPQDSVYV